MLPKAKLIAAKRVIANWRQCFISAAEAELELLRDGWYNINFRARSVRAAYLGTEYHLED